MVRVLIPTQVNDIHAAVVALALRERGHEAVLWHGADFPTRQCASLAVSPHGHLSWEARGTDLELADERFDVVWNRRLNPPVLPDDMHAGDRQIAKRECRSFHKAVWHLVAPDAFWVNPLAGRERYTSKPVQLVEAARAGLLVPPTLCSNDPRRIREFLRQHPKGVIYKGYKPAQWRSDDRVALLFTTEVREEDLPDDDVLRLAPGIFQPLLPKAYELRVTYIGERGFAARILSQERDLTRLDWRHGFMDQRLEPAVLSATIDRGCRELMRRLGLVFGCFDFVVTPEGDHVFLEVNEMGQFLWVEQLAPEVRLLAPFCELLIQGRPDYRWQPSEADARFWDFRDRALSALEPDAERHVDQPMNHSVEDRAVPTGAGT